MASDADIAIPKPLAHLLPKTLKGETNTTRMSHSTAAPISISKAAPSTATAAATGSSDTASSSSSFSDYHSTLSNPAATALLAHLSPRHPPRQRTDSFSSSIADEVSHDRTAGAAEDGPSTDRASVSSTPNRRRFRQAGPALLKPRPSSIATTASNFNLDDLQNENASTASNASLIAHSSSETDDLDTSPGPSKSKGKARGTLHPQGSPQVSESHLSATNRAHPENDYRATEQLRKLQLAAAASKRHCSGSPHTLPQLPRQALQLAAKPKSKAQPSHVNEISAGHPDALVQRDFVRHAEDDELQCLLQNQQTHPSALFRADMHNQHHLLRTFEDAEASPQASQNAHHRLRRRKAYRTLSSKHSQGSLSLSEDDWDGRTSSSSLEDRLSNLTYTTTQSASQLWKSRDNPAQPRLSNENGRPSDAQSDTPPRHQMTALEKQIHDDSEKIKAASESIFGRVNEAKETDEDTLALMISIQIQIPGMSAVGRLLANRKSLFSASTSQSRGHSPQVTSAEFPCKPSRRRPDLLKHQYARKDLLFTALPLNRRNIVVKIMVVGVLLGSWIGRAVGLL